MKFESQLQIVTAAGVPPFTVNQTALVINLNADLLDGQHGSYYAAASSLGNYLPLTGGTLTGTLTGTVGIFTTLRATELTSLLGSNGPITITPDGTGHVHINSTDIRIGPNNTNATLATRGTGDLILRTHEGSAVEGSIRIYDGANGNIEITPNGTGTVVVGKLSGSTASFSGQITSTVATGTAPLVITSTTAVTNLNADLLDGQHASYFENRDTTAVGFSGGTLTLTRAAGNLTVSLDGRYLLLTGGAITGNTTFSGDNHLTFGPNSTWSNSIRIGGNGYTATGTQMASVATTNGNLHLDSAKLAGRGVYLNWYGGTAGTYFGNGSSGQVGLVDGSGNASFIGTLSAVGAITQNGNQVLHAGNYTSYAIRSQGGLSVDISNTSLDTATTTGFFRGSAMTGAPDAGWWYIIVESHDLLGTSGWVKQTVTAYGAGNSYTAGTTFIRVRQGGSSWNAWIRELDSVNYNSFALPLTGGTLTGGLTGTSLTLSSLATLVNSAGTSYNENVRFPRANSGYVSLALACDTSGSGSIAGQFNVVVYPTAVSGGAFAIRANNSDALTITTAGAVNIPTLSGTTAAFTGAITQGGNQVVHAGNVSTYALPITGGALTGTISIDTSGATALVSSVIIKRSGQSSFNFGQYLGAWRSALQIQSNASDRLLFLAPPEADYQFGILRAANGGLKIDVGGTTANQGNNAVTIDTAGTANFPVGLQQGGNAVVTAATTSAPNLSIGGSAAQLNGQAASYYENRDTTAVGFSSGTLTLTRAAGNLAVSLDGRYLPLTGGTVSGVVRINNQLQVGQNTNGTATIDAYGGYAWFGRDSNSTGIRIDGSANVHMTAALNVVGAITQNGNQVLHAGNYSSYALPLTGGTITGQLSVNGTTASDILRLYTTGSTVWKFGVTDASGTALNITADFGSFTINKANGNVTTPGAFVGANFSGPGTGLTGTAASLNIGGNAATVTNGVYTSGDQIITGAKYFLSNKGAASTVGANNTYSLEAFSNDGGAAGMSFHRGGYYAVNFGLDPDNVLRIGGWSAGANRWQLDMSGNQTLAGNITAVNGVFSGSVTSTYGNFTTPGVIVGDSQYGIYINSGNVYFKSQATGAYYWRNIANSANTMSLDNSGNLSITGIATVNGIIAPGIDLNYAASDGWTAGTGDGVGYYGGNFGVNGTIAENTRSYKDTPYASPGLVWATTSNDATSDADGGWNKGISGLTANKTYRSIVWVRRSSASTSGNFYHGCSSSTTLNLDNTANSNPYFSSFSINTLTQSVWYLSVGYVHANNDGSTTSYGGLYDGTTGQKVLGYTDFKMAAGATDQVHRVYLYYSTDPAALLDFWGPRFEEVDGNEPSIGALLGFLPSPRFTGTPTVNGNTIIHAGNYTSYPDATKLPLTGGTLTGTLLITPAFLSINTLADGYVGIVDPSHTTGWGVSQGIAGRTGDCIWAFGSNGGTGNNDTWYFGIGSAANTTFGTAFSITQNRKVNFQNGLDVASGSLTQGGNQVLHAGNYNSYALGILGDTFTIADWNTLTTFGSRRTAPDGADLNGPPINQYGNLLVYGHSTGVTQLHAGHDGRLAWRTKWNASDWTSWVTALDTGNYTNYPPARWATGRTISLTGDVTGTSGTFDGTANLSFVATIPNSIVTNAKLNTMGAQTIKGNNGAVANSPSDLSVAQVATMLSGQTMNINGSSASCTGNAATATNLSANRLNWVGSGVITAVVGELAWKNYNNGHTIFDASASTAPGGTSINNTNAQVAWTGTYPTLMGWNGVNTYGVRVDSARIADTSTQLNGQAASYYENRDTTAVGFSGGTLTLTRAAGNLTVSLDGRYLPLSGGTLTGALNVTGIDQGLAIQHNGNTAAWFGRIITKNSTSDKASFLGTYGTVAGVFAHNNALNAWADLYINTVDGSTGGTVRMPSSVLINGNQALHAGNYTSYSPSLTGGGASGTWGINISGSSASCSGNAATCTTANGIADGTVSTTAKLANSVVTYAKIQNVGAASVLGNTSASVSQAPQEITFANLGPYINGVARAWVTFNENPSTGAITINASLGISSVTRLAAGVYQVNFSTAFSDTHYAVSGTIGYESISAYTNGGYLALTRTATPKATTSCEVCALYGGTNYNARYVHVVFHR